jgi:hypothetical protein
MIACILAAWMAWVDDREPILLRGPVHEAFAQPLTDMETPALTITRRPEAALNEVPSAIKPAGASTIWIPGYWGWDPAAEELLWVHGVWRRPPPGMRWVPGYWSERDDGWRWVGGFWSPLDQPRLRYLPPPPPKDEQSAPPSAGQFAVAGHWAYATGRYVWNEGFSAAHRKGWVWMPSHYMSTPRGALFLPGYWDYALDARGLLFAPTRGGGAASSTPRVAVNLVELPEALFTSAGLGHFYFGDYFDADHHADLKPWYDVVTRSASDPLFAYERWRHQLTDANWAGSLAERYRLRRDHPELRPSSQVTERQPPHSAEGQPPRLGVLANELARTRDASRPVSELEPEALRRVGQNAEALRLLAVQRSKFESSGKPASHDNPVAFYLPAPTEPLEHPRSTSTGRSGAGSEFVPGVAGRRVPGTSDRTLPGTSGRTLPGVDTTRGSDLRGAVP